MHCASAGEFEQGKPLIEELKKNYPQKKVLVSFYSPSGYQSGKKYRHADYTCYLPEDTPANATKFLGIVDPALVIFVKYDFWYHHLHAVAGKKIPLLLISSNFRKQQPFFNWYGALHRKMLSSFTRLFVQDERSKELLAGIGIQHVTVAGDTRFDRVLDIASAAIEFPVIKAFGNSKPVLVAGSTWPDDVKLLSGEVRNFCKMIIAPHEIHENEIKELLRIFPGAIRYSKASQETACDKDVMIIDNYGMLSSLYRYATIAYIGGGFNKSGIHNTLEAAVWNCPVIFGPQYQKFREARELVERRGAYTISTSEQLADVIGNLLADEDKLKKAGNEAGDYVMANAGACKKIMNYIQENRLLTT